MITEEQLISYKQNFTGQNFQWVKTDRPELMGKLVKCRNIDIVGNNVMAIFDDGSQVSVKELNNKLLMIHGDMKPLSKEEVTSIYAPAAPITNDPKAPPMPGAAPVKPVVVAAPVAPVKPEVNPFEMFNSDETELGLKLKIKLPDKKLLKMMYNNAEDKKEFLNQLSKYVTSMINNNVIHTSLSKMLDTTPKPPKAEEKGSEVKLTEVK